MTTAPLEWTYVQSGIEDFFRTPALLWGARELLLIDSGFTRATGRRLVDEIRTTGKEFRRIFITCAESGIHVWMADTPTREERVLWIESLDAMLAKPPIDALPGHMIPGSNTGAVAIQFTRQYLVDFERELARTADATALIRNMKLRYPNLAMDFVLDLGAKVCKGEAKWP